MGVIGRIIEAIVELWIPAVILLVGLTLLLGRKRIGTVLALVAVALFIIAAFKRITAPTDEPIARSQPRTSLATAIESLDVDRAQLADLRITGSTAPWRFSGTVTNVAGTHTLTSALVEITRIDCYEGALDPSGCVVLWKGTKRVDLNLPPGDTRNFVEPISPRGSVPRAQGELRDEFKLLSLNGRRQAETIAQ